MNCSLFNLAFVDSETGDRVSFHDALMAICELAASCKSCKFGSRSGYWISDDGYKYSGCYAPEYNPGRAIEIVVEHGYIPIGEYESLLQDEINEQSVEDLLLQ